MRLPRFRFTVRRIMVAVAAVAVALGCLAERRARLLRIAGEHRSSATAWGFRRWEDQADGAPASRTRTAGRAPPGTFPAIDDGKARHFDQLSRKYQAASGRPWLPVDPDPPEPPDRADPPDPAALDAPNSAPSEL